MPRDADPTGAPAAAICPVCGDPTGAGVHPCDACGVAAHADCWLYAGDCATYGCGAGLPAALAADLAEVGVAAPPDRPGPRASRRGRSRVCTGCLDPLKRQVAVRCRRCSGDFHWACWSANEGCFSETCRGLPGPRPPGDLVRADGDETCLVCARRPPDELAARCSGCGGGYHEGCWQANTGCTLAKCRRGAAKLRWAHPPAVREAYRRAHPGVGGMARGPRPTAPFRYLPEVAPHRADALRAFDGEQKAQFYAVMALGAALIAWLVSAMAY